MPKGFNLRCAESHQANPTVSRPTHVREPFRARWRSRSIELGTAGRAIGHDCSPQCRSFAAACGRILHLNRRPIRSVQNSALIQVP